MSKPIPTSPAAHGLHQRAQKASTLMRGALKKPSTNLTRIQHLAPGLNPQRELRARKISKHQRVDHFGYPSAKSSFAPKAGPVLQGEVINKTESRHPAGPQPNSQAVALPSMVTSASHQKIERLLDAALTQADAHKQAMKYHAARHFWQRPGFLGRHRWLKLSSILLVVIVAGLFLAWRKMPQLSVKVAAVRAHISASVPGYKPDGYSVAAPATINSGAVVIKYSAPNNDPGFEVSEKTSNMTSTSLAKTVIPQGKQVQTSHVDGNTVYIYGENNDASWVNNGVLYTIHDHSQLSSDEIIKIVHSLN